MEKKYKYHSIAVSPEAGQQIKIIAAHEGKTIREVVEQAVREYIEGQKKAKHE
jgi:predicted DNA-binding protein